MSKNDKEIDRLKIAVSRSLSVITKNDMDKLASFIEKIVRIRTRLGFGVKQENGERHRLTPLKGNRTRPKSSTVKQREYKKNKGELSELTTPQKSNLTMTGQMLDSIKWAINGLSIKLFIGNDRRKDGRNTNQEVAEYVSVKRPFFNLSKSEINQIRREAEKLIKSKLAKSRFKS